MGSAPKRLGLVVPVFLVGVAATGLQDVDQSLRDAARAGQVEAVRTLLAESTPDLDAADARGWTALMQAVAGGYDEIVEMLVEAGANLDQRDQSGQTALHLAARYGRTASADLLLRAGADFQLRDGDGRTPLYRAIEARRAEIIEMLQGVALAKGRGVLSLSMLESPEQALPPRIIESTEAPYTESARAEGIEGSVVLMVLVRRDGSVGAISVSEGLEPSLDQSALSTVRRWKFAPAMRSGRTVEVVLEVEVEFRLPSEPGDG
jgi:TonB family protein